MLDLLALDGVAVLVEDRGALARQHDPVAVFEIADRVGERAERDGVGAEIHLAVAISDRKRWAVAGADHEVVVTGEDEAEREGPAQPRQRQLHRFHGLVAAREQIVHEMQHDLGVGLGVEHRALLLELLAQLAEILDDAVVDHGNAFGRVRMGIVDGRLAVGGPAGVADAGRAFERLGLETLLQVLQLALGAAAREMLAFERGDARGVVAAIFKTFERIHQLLCNRRAPENADNPAHADQYPPNRRKIA